MCDRLDKLAQTDGVSRTELTPGSNFHALSPAFKSSLQRLLSGNLVGIPTARFWPICARYRQHR
ncbi:hypothetical protein QN386_24545 [Pseudomonas sp. CCI3.2]|uniref:hypothetical protein n=1 Tax=unclassified Pseudomonas TaxID=196821 RepID=UPI002AC899F0|nr:MULTISPECIES: hypothetical protein [unclassified Pseudomonas]MEB0077278.1 hypothetical protein [Pseudomonas sp. MH10out]MEB0091391.1 hypothetical protein [Pseudomonas sp. CCI4.2]MEB0104476.1 hypothetical protein [Pseudomonas sp. CCI3.2]MEB0129259.1 hypothetical protein [Pseudomonas sp. CCI2.4]WPX26081.1 hypothetical protein RHM64_14025 [Pseudomonas sp. AH2]